MNHLTKGKLEHEYPGHATAIVDMDGLIKWCDQDDNDACAFLKSGEKITTLIPMLSKIDKELQEFRSPALVEIGSSMYIVKSDLFEAHIVLSFEKTVLSLNKDKVTAIPDQDFYKMLMESKYEGYIFLDLNGTIQYANGLMTKYSKKKLVGHHFNEYGIDPEMLDILNTEQNELFRYMYNGRRSYIASRRPVYYDGTLIGALGQYLSIDSKDAKRVFDEDYLNVIGKLQVDELATNLMKTKEELDHYKDAFYNSNRTEFGVNKIIGNCSAVNLMRQKIMAVCQSPSPVLITGETGTGKELIANAIHYHSNRSRYPFIKVNCAAIPENLLESELFGYVEGAFSGAKKGGKKGKFELADKGVIFLDEIGDMPLSMQVKLLRVLQEKEVERLGSETTISIDVRIVTATNKDLLDLVKKGLFREDLYYRINVLCIHSPALRDRKDDIPKLIDHMMNEFNQNLGKCISKVTPEAMQLLVEYQWPGNVRELRNVIESAMNYCSNDVLDIGALPALFHEEKQPGHGSKLGVESVGLDFENTLRGNVNNTEKEQIIEALKEYKGSRRKTAEALSVSKSTLYRLMKKHNLLG